MKLTSITSSAFSKRVSILILFAWLIHMPLLSQSQVTLLIDSLKYYYSQNQKERGIELGESLMKSKSLDDYPTLRLDVAYTLAKIYLDQNSNEVVHRLLNQAIDLAKENNFPVWSIKAYDVKALAYFNTSQYDSARIHYEHVMNIAKEKAYDRYPASLANLAFINAFLGQTELEIYYYLEALKVLETNPGYDELGGIRAMAFGGLGDYYLSIGEYKKAQQNFAGKMYLGQEKENKRYVYEALLGIGSLYANKGYLDFEKSKLAYEQIIKDTHPDFDHYRGNGLIGLGKLLESVNRDEESLNAFKDALEIYENYNSSDWLSQVQLAIGNIYFKNSEYIDSKRWIDLAWNNAIQNNLALRERDVLKLLYKLDSLQKDYRTSLVHYQRFRAIEDSLQNMESKNRIKELQIKYETEQIDKQNLLLKNDLILKESELRQKTILQFVFGFIFILMLIIVFMIHSRYKTNRKLNLILASKNKQISKQRDELQFKSDKLQIINSQLKSLFDFRKDLISMIAHDMKNPLNSIIGLSLSMDNDKRINSITKSGQQLLNLITNMLEVDRMEEVKVEPKKERIEIDDLFKKAREQVELLVIAKSINYQNLLPKNLVVIGDRELLIRVLSNMLTNAIKYSKNGDQIKIYHNHKPGFVEVTIQDQGVGISPERLPFVFDKFWRAEKENSGLATSNGLGLTYCKLAIESHGGAVKIESKLNYGTKISFTLPYQGQHIPKSKESLIKKANLILETEAPILESYWMRFRELKVYEVSKLKPLVAELGEIGVKSFWKEELVRVIYQGSQIQFDILIAAIKPNVKS